MDRPMWEYLPPRPVTAREVAACLSTAFAETTGEDVRAKVPTGEGDTRRGGEDPPYEHLLVFDACVHYLVLDDTEASMLVGGEPVRPDDPEFGEYVGPQWRKVGSVEDGPGNYDAHYALREFSLVSLGKEVARARSDGSRRHVQPNGGYGGMTPELAAATRADLTRDREKAFVEAADAPLDAFVDSDLDAEDYVDEDDLKAEVETDLDAQIAQAKADAEDVGTVVERSGNTVVVSDGQNTVEIPGLQFGGDPPGLGQQVAVEDLDLDSDPSSGSYALDLNESDGESDTVQGDEGLLRFPDGARIDTTVSFDSPGDAARTHLDHPQGRVEVVLSMNAIYVRAWRDGSATLLAEAAVSLGSTFGLTIERDGRDLALELINTAGNGVETIRTQAWPSGGEEVDLVPPRYCDLDGKDVTLGGFGDADNDRYGGDTDAFDPAAAGANPPGTFERVSVQDNQQGGREVGVSADVSIEDFDDEAVLDALRYQLKQPGGSRE